MSLTWARQEQYHASLVSYMMPALCPPSVGKALQEWAEVPTVNAYADSQMSVSSA
jgi:hypothetical protein